MTATPQRVDGMRLDRADSVLFARAVEKNRFLDMKRHSNVTRYTPVQQPFNTRSLVKPRNNPFGYSGF